MIGNFGNFSYQFAFYSLSLKKMIWYDLWYLLERMKITLVLPIPNFLLNSKSFVTHIQINIQVRVGLNAMQINRKIFGQKVIVKKIEIIIGDSKFLLFNHDF